MTRAEVDSPAERFQLTCREGIHAKARMFPPSRIVCLTEETVETLYLLGEQDRIVGISSYVVRPSQARREKPRVEFRLDLQALRRSAGSPPGRSKKS
jgi:ABC-type hemin transport system substrate-binding protein